MQSVVVGTPWSERELRITVETYIRMLKLELEGKPYNKRLANRELQATIGRSAGAIEFKHCNISHVLREMRLLYIEGYKPRSNVQGRLRDVLSDALMEHQDLLILMFQQIVAPVIEPVGFVLAEGTPPEEAAFGLNRSEGHVVQVDFASIEAMNRELGLAGELAVLEHEKQRLRQSGSHALSERVRHISVEEGDGLGYDILSFNEDGSARYIEVKTTRRPKEWPFMVTRNELTVSKKLSDKYYLYRVFSFNGAKPGYYALRGSLADTCMLQPNGFTAVPSVSWRENEAGTVDSPSPV